MTYAHTHSNTHMHTHPPQSQHTHTQMHTLSQAISPGTLCSPPVSLESPNASLPLHLPELLPSHTFHRAAEEETGNDAFASETTTPVYRVTA